MGYLEERVRATPVLELLAATREAVSFRYRSGNPENVQLHLANALRESGFAAVRAAQADGRGAIQVAPADFAREADADALVAAAVALGAVAANGLPVPKAVTANIRADGLPAYIGFSGLWRLEDSGIEMARLGPMLDARTARDPDDAAALMDTATLLFLSLIPGNRTHAFAAQARALKLQQVFRLPAWRDGKTLRVLAIAGPGDMTSNTHLDCLLEDSAIELVLLYVREGQPLPRQLPEHDVVFVAVGEAAHSRNLLGQFGSYLASSPRPVLNRPEKILQLSRDRVADLLQAQPGIEMPATRRVRKDQLEKHLANETFPVLIRPLDSQGGKDLAKLDGPAALADYLGATAETEFFVCRFVDYSGADRLFRKYRVVVIQGRAYACHLAISINWMIHYVNADMDASAEKREEEARFMAEFDTGFGARHGAALACIDRLLGLEYYGIDCGETPDGKLLVFEVDTAMLVHAMDSPELYPYKRPQMLKLFGAFREMLERAAKPSAT